jgi:hypothetical protein
MALLSAAAAAATYDKELCDTADANERQTIQNTTKDCII